MSILLCALKSLLDLLNAAEQCLILLCKPACELLMLAIGLVYVGILKKIEINILNLKEVL